MQDENQDTRLKIPDILQDQRETPENLSLTEAISREIKIREDEGASPDKRTLYAIVTDSRNPSGFFSGELDFRLDVQISSLYGPLRVVNLVDNFSDESLKEINKTDLDIFSYIANFLNLVEFGSVESSRLFIYLDDGQAVEIISNSSNKITREGQVRVYGVKLFSIYKHDKEDKVNPLLVNYVSQAYGLKISDHPCKLFNPEKTNPFSLDPKYGELINSALTEHVADYGYSNSVPDSLRKPKNLISLSGRVIHLADDLNAESFASMIKSFSEHVLGFDLYLDGPVRDGAFMQFCCNYIRDNNTNYQDFLVRITQQGTYSIQEAVSLAEKAVDLHKSFTGLPPKIIVYSLD